MNDTEPIQSLDDEEVEIATLDSLDGSLNVELPSWQQRVQFLSHQHSTILRVATVIACVLLLALITREDQPALPTLSIVAQSHLYSDNTIPFSPAYASVYISASLPWTRVYLDGQPLRPPRIGIDPAIKLMRGHHVLTWLAEPFLLQSCEVSVPMAIGDNCTFGTNALGQQDSSQMLILPMSLGALAPAQQHALFNMVQSALKNISTSVPVQPGEQYAGPNGYVKATRPLHAMLHFQLDNHSAGGASYTVAGQECEQLCAIPWQPFLAHSNDPNVKEWLALVFITSSWSYTNAAGHVIAQNQPIDLGGAAGSAFPILLRIAWNGSSWYVKALVGPDQVPSIVMIKGIQQYPIHPADKIQVADDPACIAARDLLSSNMLNLPQKRFISGPNPAGGCLAVTVSSQTNTPGMPGVAMYFEHFGVLLAVNNLAHKLMPYLPLADSYEQALARQLQAYPGQIITTP